MDIFTHSSYSSHEQVLFCNDASTGLKAIIAIHDTTLGPALGGTRMWNYANVAEALTDVLRLSRGMTYKAAIAGLNLGGGKAVIIGDPSQLKSEKFFRSYGRFVENLSGRYITAEDVNIRVDDMESIAKETSFYAGGKSGSGDPSPVTALGVFHGIRASVKHKMSLDSLSGLTIGVQGCGNVGYYLCQYLSEAGAKLLVSDFDSAKVKRVVDQFHAKEVSISDIHKSKVDVFAPCALGGILNTESIKQLNTKIIAGGANNQLLDENMHGSILKESGILFAPDYVINAGGLINCYQELIGYNRDKAQEKTKEIYHTLLEIFRIADEENITTIKASNRLAESNIAKVRSLGVPTGFNKLTNQNWYTRKF